MLDGLLNRGFSSKCKSLLKATRTRIEVVRRRAEAKQRFLKEDLAKLLTNGLDINAYGRTEEFLAGLNLLSCYDFIEQSCDYVVKNLSSMQKQRECPEECRETVASLMFAAARFSDLPELRDVRDLFQERYGSSLECFVNKKFVEKLSSRPPIMEKKIQLLQDIALEFSINWDSRGFEQRMTAPSTPAQVQGNKSGHSNVAADKCNLLNDNGNVAKSDKDDVLPKETPIVGNIGRRIHHGRESNDLRREELDPHCYGRKEISASGLKQLSYKGGRTAKNHDDILFHEREEDRVSKHEQWVKKDSSLSKAEKSSSSSNGNRLDSSGSAYSDQNDVKNDIHKRESWKALSQEKTSVSPSFGGISGKNEDLFAVKLGGISGKNENFPFACEHGSSQNEVNLLQKVLEEGVDGLKSYHSAPRPPPYVKSKSNAMPPPYVKPKESKQKTARSEHAGSYCDDGLSLDPLPHNRVDEVNGSDWIQGELDAVHEGQMNGSTRVRSHEKKQCYQDDKIPLRKPRSLRRKHHKSLSSHNDVSHVEDAGSVKRSSSSRRRDHSQKGLQILVDYEHFRKDEEEKMIDKLLLHYSKKPWTFGDVGNSRKISQAHPSHQGARDTGESSQDQERDSYDGKTKIVPPPARSVSLPREQSAPSEAKKIFARANSFQPDSQARHVHPKLPDYDDLAARFAALKGR